MKTILILAANPRSDLRVDREIRDLEKAIERSKNSDKFTIKIKLAVLPEDLQEFLYDNKPYIVHFCGHGIKENYLVFESEDRGEQKVSYQAFSNLLKNSNSRENIQCVLLNACHTEPLVDLIVEYIPYAIGTSREILDKAAYWFALGFYKALVREKSIESCCQWGCNAVELNMPDVNIATETTGQFRKLVAIEEDDSEIESEPLKIILKCKNSLKNLSKESSFSSNIPPELEQELLEEGRRKKYRDNLRSVLDNFGKTILERDEQISDFELKQRETLVNKVKDFWIKGFLKPSLYFNTAVDKDKDHPSGQILRPLGDLEVISFDIDESYDTLLQTDIRGEISDGNTLLILGEPGSGKTIALLQLAEKLIARTKQNTKRPIPVVFNLSSWVEKQLPLEEWLIKELKDKYQVPKVWSESWIREQKLTLLLDGLDEVGNGFKDNAKKINLQSKCIEAINMFISDDHLDTEIVVCSRVKEYEALSKRLLLSSVICIQPLSKKQLLDFLENVDDSLLGLKTVIENDPEIAEFAQTPLILNVMSLAYQDWSTKDLLEEFLSTENLYSQLFNSYIQRMLNSGESIQTEQQYPRDKVLHWLSWLAKQMIEKSKIIFLIEKLKPQSLENTKDRRKYQIENVVLIFGTIYFSFKLMGIVLFLCIYPIVLSANESSKLLNTIAFMINSTSNTAAILVGTLGGLLIILQKEILLFEKISFSWSIITNEIFVLLKKPRILFSIILIGPIFGLVRNVTGQNIVDSKRWLNYGLGVGLSGILLFVIPWGLIQGFLKSLNTVNIEKKNDPNQGIWMSRTNFFVTFLRFGGLSGLVVFGIIFLSGVLIAGIKPTEGITNALLGGSYFGLGIGLFLGLFTGGITCIQHFNLRQILYFKGYIPWNYAHFLDYASKLLLMKKIGGGYVFYHRMLMEHFANMKLEK